MATRRGKDLRILYDRDNGQQVVIAQRTYQDQDQLDLTPITPSLTARIQAGTPLDRGRIDPRHLEVCFSNPGNSQGFSEMRVNLPYLPGSPELLRHIREVREWQNGPYATETMTYFGEGLP